MARVSQTELAVLGALSVQPMTGYALREAIRDVLGQFWSESFGQIYPTLAALEAEGRVSREPGARRGSSRMALTEAGRERLRELLAAPAVPAPPRNPVLLRLFFGHVLGAQASADLVRAQRERAEASLARLTTERQAIEEESPSEHQRYALLVVSAGEHSARAVLAWADEALTALGR